MTSGRITRLARGGRVRLAWPARLHEAAAESLRDQARELVHAAGHFKLDARGRAVTFEAERILPA